VALSGITSISKYSISTVNLGVKTVYEPGLFPNISNNGHVPDSDHNDINYSDYSEKQFDIESEITEQKKTKKPLLKWAGLGLIITIIGLTVFDGEKKFISNVLPQKEQTEEIDVSANPETNDTSPIISQPETALDYMQSQRNELINGQGILAKNQYNRLVWLMKNNLLAEAKKAKGISPEDYLLSKAKAIATKYQVRIADNKLDFSSAIGLEDSLLLIPRLEALLLAYREILGQDLSAEYLEDDKIPPDFAPLIATLKQLHTVGENARQLQPEAQLREQVATERRLAEQERKLKELEEKINESKTKQIHTKRP